MEIAGCSPEPPRPSAADAAWLRPLVRAIDAGVLLLSPQERSPEFANAAALEILGCGSLQELCGRWPEILASLEAATESVRPDGTRVIDCEVEVKGRKRALRWRVDWADAASCEAHVLLVRDLGVVLDLERELRRAASFSALARVHSAVSHDLRSPLNAIGLELEVLRQCALEHDGTLPEGFAAELSRGLDVVERELRRFKTAFEPFLRHSQPQEESPRGFDFQQALASVAELLQPLAKAQRVELVTEQPAGEVSVHGRRALLESCVLLVALNGLDAMPDGGRLALSLRADEQALALTVSDTGPGIPRAILGRIWDLHFSTRPGRSGLGLHVARSIALEHGGSIVVEPGALEPREGEPRANRGSRFRITLPRSKAPSNP